jgi:hypothetical protein
VDVDYFVNLVVPSWLHRSDPRAGHHCLNVVLDSLIKIIFPANDKLIPFDKWTLNLSYTLSWTPSHYGISRASCTRTKRCLECWPRKPSGECMKVE